MTNIMKKLIKLGAGIAIAFALSLQSAPVEVEASLGDPTVVAMVNGNPLGSATATSTVTLVADRPVIFYLYDEPKTESYSTTFTITKGFGSPKYSVVDQSGKMSAQITVNMDLNQEPILTGVPTSAGLESVTLHAMKNAYYVVNGVKESSLTISKTFTARGDYTVYAESLEGLKSNVVTFSIPTKGGSTTTTTKPKPITTVPKVTSSKPNTTSKGSTGTTGPVVSGELPITLKNVIDGGVTSSDVTIDSATDVFFVVNGEKDAKVSKTKTWTEEGSYTVHVVNAKNVQSAEVSFVIDKSVPTLTLSIDGVEQTPGIFTSPLKITSNEQGVFKVNGEEMYGTDNAITVDKSGSYTVEFYDLADNKVSVDFVLDIADETNPDSSSKNNGWILYLVLGLLAGAGVALGGTYLMNKRK